MFRITATQAFRYSTSALFLHQPLLSSTWSQISRAVAPHGCKVFHSVAPRLKVDKKLEKKLAKEKIPKCDPSEVSSTSTIRPLIETSPARQREDHDMGEDLKHDINVIVDTVALKTVPKTAHLLGLAGTLPYAATSLTTLYLGWDLKQQWAPSLTSSFMVTHEHAIQLLAFLEPIQIGYGAVIISFLGAIHWGMEFNERSLIKDRTRFRYTMGVISPAIAWPSIMMPIEYALMYQMIAFTSLYFADTKASTKGWTPAWYGTYRFVLTFIVCTAIVLSLIGRQTIADSSTHVLAGNEMRERMDKTAYNERHNPKWTRIEKEMKEKMEQDHNEAKEASKSKDKKE